MSSSGRNKRFLEAIEYGSLVGAFAALFYRQLMFASAPLLAGFIWLNMSQRRQLEKISNQQALQNQQQIGKVERQLFQQIRSLKQELPPQVNLLSSQLHQWQESSSNLINQNSTELAALNRQFQQIQGDVSSLQLTAGDHTSSLGSLLHVSTAFKDQLDQAISDIAILQRGLSQLQTELNSLEVVDATFVEGSVAEVQSTMLQSIAVMTNNLNAQLTCLSQRTQALETSDRDSIQPRLTRLQQEIQALYDGNSALSQEFRTLEEQLPATLEPLQAQMQALQQAVNQQKAYSRYIQMLRNSLSQLQRSLRTVAQQDQISLLQTQMAQLEQQGEALAQTVDEQSDRLINTLQDRIQSQLNSLRFVDADFVRKTVSDAESQLTALISETSKHLDLRLNDQSQETKSLLEEAALGIIQPLIANLEEEIQTLQSEDITLKSDFGTLSHAIADQQIRIVPLQAQIAQLDQQRQALAQTVDEQSDRLTQLLQDRVWINRIEKKLDELQGQQAKSASKQISQAEIDVIMQAINQLKEIYNQELQQLPSRIASAEQQIGRLHNDWSTVLSEKIDEIAEYISQPINEALQDRRYEYKLIHGRNKSRKCLIDAISSAQTKLILVCPWLNKAAINDQVLCSLEKALDRGVSISIGWGHKKDIDEVLKEPYTSQDSLENRLIDYYQESWKYSAVKSLINLKSKNRRYSGNQIRLHFYSCGTHEKYLICDDKYAVLGSHNFLTSNTGSLEKELGIFTTNKQIIQELTHYFEDLHLEKHETRQNTFISVPF